jgi:hypothetical protein
MLRIKGNNGLDLLMMGLIIIMITFSCLFRETMGGGDGEGEGDNNGISHGLGDHIGWLRLDEGKEVAEQEGKPLMLIIHKSWCGACKCETFLF